MFGVALVTSLLAFAPVQDEDGPQPPDPELVEATAEKLATAFAKGDPAERVRAITDARPVLHPDVVAGIAKGLKDKERTVVEAALEALRFMDLPASLETLHKAHKSNRALKKDEAHFARLLKAIGQHGSPTSLKLLADNPFAVLNHDVVKTRILAIGRVRSAEAVGELINLMQKVGRLKSQPYMEDFRLALTVLTGSDQGPTRDAWIAWWNDNKKSLVVATEVPEVPKRFQEQWRRFWNEKPKKQDAEGDEEREDRRERRKKKRGGGDGE